jgi:hypothetical protein
MNNVFIIIGPRMGRTLLITVSLLLSLHVILVRSEICHLCPNENHTSLAGDMASFLLPSSGLFMKCSEAEKLAPDGFFSNCTGLHNLAADICECGLPSDETFQCPLCGEGTSILPFPDRVVANKTCQEWQDDANRDFEMDCFSWQKSFGSYCGCDVSAPGHFDGFCRICNDSILSKPNNTVTFIGRNGIYSEFCAFLEQDFNTKSDLDCEAVQKNYSSVCACGWDNDIPDNPRENDESSSYMKNPSGFMIATLPFLVFVVLAM